MTPSQRQLIKEAYQEGYYQALDEGLLRFLKNLFRGGKAATRTGATKFGVRTTTPNDILNQIDDLSKQLDRVDDLDYNIPDLDQLMKNKYIRSDGTIDADKVRDALLDKKTLDKLMKDIERRKRLEDFALDLGLDPDDLDPNDFGDIG